MQEIDSVTSAGDIPVDNHDEDTPMLPGRIQTRSWLAMRYNNTRKCVSNKAALLILLWSFVVGLLNATLLNPEMYLRMFVSSFSLIPYGVIVVFTCFFPLAGILADIKFGRYKTVVTSIFIVLLTVSLGILVTTLTFTAAAGIMLPDNLEILMIVSCAIGGILTIALYVGLVGFTANVVQFGIDQLHDSPGEDNTLFIHWYVWTYYASFLVVQFDWNLGLPTNDYSPVYHIIGFCLLALIPVVVVIVLTITLCLVRRRRRWFLIEPGRLNPYKLVYRVTKFARQHKIPVQRSAFTFCEDELPSGLDLGKEKYGGCFTTEQVEDVKAFYGILKVLFSFGIVFFMDFAADSILPLFALHITPVIGLSREESLVELLLLNTGLPSPLLIVICIPLYLCLLRPFISQYVPGMMKRMGLGMFLVLLSLLASFFMDTAAHLKGHHEYNNTKSSYCMFDYEVNYPSPQTPALLLIQLTLSALSHMLIYTAMFEFICSQSPHSMKGLLIGVLYAIRGLYQLVATLLVLPFTLTTINLISCGFWYYFMNIVIGVVALLVYTCVAKSYRYRERDEFCNIHQYAENYYSNQQLVQGWRGKLKKTDHEFLIKCVAIITDNNYVYCECSSRVRVLIMQSCFIIHYRYRQKTIRIPAPS